MKRGKNWIFAIGIVLIVAFSLNIILSEKYITAEKVDANILKQFDSQNNSQNQEKVKVIVTLEDTKTKGLLKASSNSNLRENVINEIGKEKVRYRFSSSNSFSAELTKQEVEELSSLSSVKKIYYDYPVHAFLQDSVGIINATLTWPEQINGINLTGSGQTICIIDTGVNYTHPDLGGCYGNNTANSTCKVLGGYDYVHNDSNPIDDNGHGTHVTGIVSANGTIKGIAPDSKIISIKVLNSVGSGSDSNVIKGIEWCVDNASMFNISVISMSLGGDLNSSYCDSSDLTSVAINSAIAKNISVVIATGNDGSTTSITYPSCNKNATRVADTYDADIGEITWTGGCTDATTYADKIVCHANRNPLVNLLAPGALINSTWITGGYKEEGGTSMATPHVAGAIAIINQMLNLTNQTKTPKQIELILNATGKRVADNASGLNFSRIDIYNAIISLDNIAPNVTLVSPTNNHVNLSQNYTFSCNATDLALKNVTFYLWNSTGEVLNQTTLNTTGSSNTSEIYIENIIVGNYKWNCKYYDENNNFGSASSNFSLIVGGVNTLLISPLNNNFTNSNNSNFSCQSLSDQNSELNNVTFYLWNLTALIYNETKEISGFDNSTLFNYTFTNEDSYKWNCLSFNNNSNSSFADENFTIIFDKTEPAVNLVSPANNDASNTGTSTVNFQFNVTDNLNITNCNLIIDNQAPSSNTSAINSSTNTISKSLSDGTYNWMVNCMDQAGNMGNSTTRTLIINSPPVVVTSSGGGGGGSPASNTYVVTEAQISNGNSYTQELKKQDKIKFTIFDVKAEQHTLTITNVETNFVDITIQSNITKLTLGVGQSVKLNLTSADYYDLYIKLENITNSEATLTIQTIHDPIIREIIKEKQNQTANETTPITNKGENQSKQVGGYLAYILLAAIIVVLFVYFLRTKERQDEIEKEIKKIERRKSRRKK